MSVIISIALKKKDIPVQKYSREWIEKLSDSEFDIEREIVRQNYCNSTLENYYKWESLLYLFDKIKVEKAPKIDRPYREPVHREHGFSLYKPD